jgi:ornithine cyclodeaminase
MTLLLVREEVEGLLDLEQAIRLAADALAEQAAGRAVAITPRHDHLPGGVLRTVSGALLDERQFGVRLGLINGLNSPSIALLYDLQGGDLLAIMSHPFGRLRTGAVMGVALRLLAREDAGTVGLLGTGENALSLLRAACHVRPVERVRVYSRNPERRARFAASAQAALGVPVQAVAEPRAATREADVLYVATDSPEPVVRAEDVASGTLVASMGEHSELDPSLYLAADLVVVGTKAHEEGFHRVGAVRHQLLDLIANGQMAWDAVRELGEVVGGQAPGRTSADQTIVFKESQGGFIDTAYASWVYAQARTQGLGRVVDLG